MPNCTEEIQTSKIEFGRLGRRVVEDRFDGASMTSDAAVMLLGAADRKLGLNPDFPLACAGRMMGSAFHTAVSRPKRNTWFNE